MIKVTLELSDRGAMAIMEVLSRVGGDRQGPRAVIDALYNALQDAGVTEDSRLAGGDITMASEWPDANGDIIAMVQRK